MRPHHSGVEAPSSAAETLGARGSCPRLEQAGLEPRHEFHASGPRAPDDLRKEANRFAQAVAIAVAEAPIQLHPTHPQSVSLVAESHAAVWVGGLLALKPGNGEARLRALTPHGREHADQLRIDFLQAASPVWRRHLDAPIALGEEGPYLPHLLSGRFDGGKKGWHVEPHAQQLSLALHFVLIEECPQAKGLHLGIVHEVATHTIAIVSEPLLRHRIGREQESRVFDGAARQHEVARAQRELVPGESANSGALDALHARIGNQLDEVRVQ